MSAENLRAFLDPDRFVAGTVGEPGSRAFYLQVRESSQMLSISIEKEQLVALSERVSLMLRELRISSSQPPFLDENVDSQPLETPIDDDFRAVAISLSYDENLEKIEIEVESENDDEVVIFLTLSQAKGFTARSKLVLDSGRPVCPFCSAPINPQGHLCPRANGYRR
jgi:uncharacterized repeat protein (TIGR03847 family)